MQRIGSAFVSAILFQRGTLFHWVPVWLGAGIGLYFALAFEPDRRLRSGVAICVVAIVLMAWRSGPVIRPLLLAVALTCAGMTLAAWRAESVSGPVLNWRYYGPVEGRIVGIDRSASDAVRLTLDQVRLDNVAPEHTPLRVRVSLHGEGGTEPRPGMVVMTTAHLSPPEGPVEPGGFDFQRHAWFLKLGGVGYSRIPLLALSPPGTREALIFRTRMWLSKRFQEGLPGETGAFAAAVTAGDRSGMSQQTIETLRVSNLAHLLAISGLHMGLLAGFVFAAMRKGLAVPQRIALYWPTTQIAAGAALVMATGYLLLSGGSIATERAYVMVAVALGALIAHRRAISLRAVALAAIIVLLLRPEALLSPGFQMSFAATLSLVVVFGVMRDRAWRPKGWRGTLLTLLLSSAVAGAATAPVAAAQFNQIAHYGLIANLLSVPVMGTFVIPAALVAVLLMPLGLQALPLWVMGLGLDWILRVAGFVAGLEGARGMVPAPPWQSLPLLTFGMLVIMLWQGRARWSGVVPVLAGFLLWAQAERPAVLIAQSGGLVGVMTEEGRALSRARSQSFVAGIWLENDGEDVSQEEAAARWPLIRGIEIHHVTGKRAAAKLGPCSAGEIVVMNVPAAEAPGAQSCDIYDPARLRETGAVALIRDNDRLLQIGARTQSGRRLWNSAEARAPARPHLYERLRDLLRRNGGEIVAQSGTVLSQ